MRSVYCCGVSIMLASVVGQMPIYKTNTENSKPACRQAGAQRATEERLFLGTEKESSQRRTKHPWLLLTVYASSTKIFFFSVALRVLRACLPAGRLSVFVLY